jgi:hypothetical protein
MHAGPAETKELSVGLWIAIVVERQFMTELILAI